MKRLRHIVAKRRIVVIVIGVAIVLLVIRVLYLRFFLGRGWAGWTGFGEFAIPTGEYQRAKTLWDWMDLLIVPFVLAGIALLFNRAQRKSELEIEEKRAQTEQKVAADRFREEVLQIYFDRMTELLLEHELRTSEPNAEVCAVARARTRTALSQLDGKKKGTLVLFLYEARLIGYLTMVPDGTLQPPIIHIGEAADLNGVVLSRTSMPGIDLGLTDMKEANLIGVDLYRAEMSGVDLSGATLLGVNLSKANLRVTKLRDVKVKGSAFAGADLQGADVAGASLEGAGFLEEANLVGAKFNSKTKWPQEFDPISAGAVLDEEGYFEGCVDIRLSGYG